MASIGETLRRERERRNLTLDQVSRELKISARFLQAHRRGTLRAAAGGRIREKLCAAIRAPFGPGRRRSRERGAACLRARPPRFHSPPPRRRTRIEPLAEFHVPKMESMGARARRRRAFAGTRLCPPSALVVVAMLGCSLVYGWWQRSRHPVTTAFASTPATQACRASANTACHPCPQQPPAAPAAARSGAIPASAVTPSAEAPLAVPDAPPPVNYARAPRPRQSGGDCCGASVGSGAHRWQVFVFRHAGSQ